MISVSDQSKKEVLDAYRFHGTLLSMNPYGNGHINDTYLLSYQIGKMGEMRVILQKMNRNVFPNPAELMENGAKMEGCSDWNHAKYRRFVKKC